MELGKYHNFYRYLWNGDCVLAVVAADCYYPMMYANRQYVGFCQRLDQICWSFWIYVSPAGAM